jgi:hypothetical protein
VGYRTSQSVTFFIISFSRANAACSRRYASLSPSASSSGTRCMRDHIFSRCSSLNTVESQSAILPDFGRHNPRPDPST